MSACPILFEKALLAMDQVTCSAMLSEAFDLDGLGGAERLLGPPLLSIGNRWERGDLALAQVYMAGRICEEAMNDLLAGGRITLAPDATRVGVAVLLDHHQLGKRIVAATLTASGFRVVDYGQGIEPEDLAQRALADRVPVLMVSVLMAASARRVADLSTALGQGPGRPLLVVGGAPFRLDPDLARRVGADAVGCNGVDAAAIAHRLLEEPCAR